MTVNTTVSKITYQADAATTVWTFPFPGVAGSNIFLFITSDLGVISQVTVGQYSVTLNPAIDPNPTSVGGSVHYPLSGPPLALGNVLTIARILPDVQPTSIANQSIIYPPIIEQEFDYLTLIDQQITEMIARAVKVGIADTPLAPLPPLAFRKNAQAVFDANGNITAGGAVIGTIISPVMIPVVTAPTLPLARSAMGVPGVDSPVFTGDPRAPTPPLNDNDTSIATTEFVQNMLGVAGMIVVSGTRMLFQQTAAPPGWTKDLTHNDKALRIVNSTVGSGGTTGFSAVFTGTTVGATTLTAAQMPVHSHVVSDPSHTHSVNDPSHSHTVTNAFNQAVGGPGTQTAAVENPGGTGFSFTGISLFGAFTGISLFNAGSGQSHTHTVDLRVLYVDFIIAQKD